ncbi:MAG TPA: hypothetical protein VIW26_04100 [Gemmatimonadales bacterium]|jgi:hypothetical protein
MTRSRQGDHASPELPPYMRRVLAALELGGHDTNTARLATVRHDAWCALLKGTGPCNCAPDVELGPDLARGDS